MANNIQGVIKLKLTSDNQTLEENKILVLYILNKIGKPISNDALLNLVLAVTDMNYFYFQQFLLDLLENGYIMNYHKDDYSFYEITEFGRETLELTQNILPGIIKLRVDANFKSELESFEEAHSVVAEYTPKSENYFTVTCKIIEHNETIFEVSTFAGSSEHAKQIVNNWKNHAEQMYPQILNILTQVKEK